MNPYSRFSASLVLGLAVSIPALSGALSGDMDFATAVLRFLAAFVVFFVAVGLVGRTFNAYVADLDAARAEREAAEAAAEAAEAADRDQAADGDTAVDA